MSLETDILEKFNRFWRVISMSKDNIKPSWTRSVVLRLKLEASCSRVSFRACADIDVVFLTTIAQAKYGTADSRLFKKSDWRRFWWYSIVGGKTLA